VVCLVGSYVAVGAGSPVIPSTGYGAASVSLVWPTGQAIEAVSEDALIVANLFIFTCIYAEKSDKFVTLKWKGVCIHIYAVLLTLKKTVS
jgi:hypothetical protein